MENLRKVCMTQSNFCDDYTALLFGMILIYEIWHPFYFNEDVINWYYV